jgi:prepilin-type N-terminal cleavage/methylation domain-containing protein
MRRGMTMVELLIVVAVMTILMGISLPMMKTGIEGARLRAAAEIVREQFTAAKSLAVQTGKPAAVVLLGDGATVTAVNTLHPNGNRYAGDVVGSQAIVSLTGPTGMQCRIDDAGAGIAISMDDRIRFANHWHAYRVTSKSLTGPPWTFDLDPRPSPPPIPDPPNWNGPVGTAQYDFVSFRRPDSSSRMPIDLPGSSCIDLSASGYGMDDDTFTLGSPISGPVTIDVAPSGSILAVRFGGLEQIPTAPLYLLIGERDAVGIRNGSVAENVTGSERLWLRIQRTNGQVTIVPNGWAPSRPTLADARGL